MYKTRHVQRHATHHALIDLSTLAENKYVLLYKLKQLS
jgi:hypothetical protein